MATKPTPAERSRRRFGGQVERRPTPAVEPLDHHDVDRSTLGRVDNPVEAGPNAAAARCPSSTSSPHAQAACGGGGT